MNKHMEQIKPLNQLSLVDFRNNHVWTLYENDLDESLAIAVNESKFLDEDAYGAFFILGQIKLCDSSILEGIIYINTANKQPYMFEFVRGEQTFSFTGRLNPSRGTLRDLSVWLKKSIELITPMIYSTDYYFKDGSQIKGIVDLKNW